MQTKRTKRQFSLDETIHTMNHNADFSERAHVTDSSSELDIVDHTTAASCHDDNRPNSITKKIEHVKSDCQKESVELKINPRSRKRSLNPGTKLSLQYETNSSSSSESLGSHKPAKTGIEPNRIETANSEQCKKTLAVSLISKHAVCNDNDDLVNMPSRSYKKICLRKESSSCANSGELNNVTYDSFRPVSSSDVLDLGGSGGGSSVEKINFDKAWKQALQPKIPEMLADVKPSKSLSNRDAFQTKPTSGSTTLAEVCRLQELALSAQEREKVAFLHSSHSTKSLRIKDRVVEKISDSVEDTPRTIEETWYNDVQQKLEREPSFFDCEEARLEKAGKVRRGLVSYSSIPLNQKNNRDLHYVYNLEFAELNATRGKSGTFHQITVTAGQFMRMAVAFKLVGSIHDVVKPGIVFGTIVDREALKVFLNYFRIRCSVTTVTAKGNQILKLLDVASVYFEENGESILEGKVHAAQRFVRSIRNTSKQEGRQRAALLRNRDTRELNGSVIHPSDFTKFLSSIQHRLTCIMNAFETCMESKDRSNKSTIQVSKRFFGGNEALLDKWCLNMLGLIVLSCAGQRPEVFWQLQVPSAVQLKQMKHDSESCDYFEIPVLREKKPRSIAMPFPIIPSKMFQFLKFHISVVRPTILWTSGECEESKGNKPLLLHSKKGTSLCTKQITAGIKKVLQHLDPEIGNVTSMMLRSSFATMMFEQYRRKEIMMHMSETEFLETVAIYMNTSVEQLRSTYILIGKESFSDVAHQIAKILPGSDMIEPEFSEGEL